MGGGGKGGGNKPGWAEVLLQKESAGAVRAGREELEAGAPFRRLLQSVGQDALLSGSPDQNQTPALQRQLNIMKRANANRRAQVLQQLGASKQAGTPFGQAILADVTGQSGVQEAALVDNALTRDINLGMQGAGLSGQIGSNLVNSGMQGMGQSAQLGQNLTLGNAGIRQQNAGMLGSGLGSLAGLAAAYMMFPSNPNLKEDIKPAKDTEALRAVRKLPISTWRYKGDSTTHLGGMTTDMPDNVIVGDLKTRLAYDPISYLGMLTGAVRALDKQLQTRKPRLRRLAARRPR